MKKTIGEDQLRRAVKDAVKKVEGELLEMVAGGRDGAIAIEMLFSRGQVRVKPTPFYIHQGAGN